MSRKLLCLLSFFLMFGLISLNAQTKLKPIFNGKNLKKWVTPANNIWWSAKDGVLSAKSGPQKKGSIMWTKKKYKDFVIETDFLFGEGAVDSGIFLRNETDQIQLGISASLKKDMTCAPYIAKKGYPVEGEGVAEVLKQKDWNTVKVEVRGMKYTAWLNGKKVMTYTSDTPFAKGPIGLQVHANKVMSIDFRNIRIAKLK